jgi:hypothetical protein
MDACSRLTRPLHTSRGVAFPHGFSPCVLIPYAVTLLPKLFVLDCRTNRVPSILRFKPEGACALESPQGHRSRIAHKYESRPAVGASKQPKACTMGLISPSSYMTAQYSVPVHSRWQVGTLTSVHIYMFYDFP